MPFFPVWGDKKCLFRERSQMTVQEGHGDMIGDKKFIRRVINAMIRHRDRQTAA